MRGFDRGPYALSRKSKNAPAGLYMPPDVRLVYNAVTSIYWLPQAARTVGAPPSVSHRDVVAYWRRKAIAFPPIDELPGGAASQGGRFNLQTTYRLLLANGGDSASGMAASTLYYVYVNPDGFVRASATAYSLSWEGVRVLGRSGSAKDWLFIGYVRTDGSTQFVDSTTDRLVVNWFNRLRSSVQLQPGYVDDNATTSYTTTSTVWTPANGGTGATGSYISNGEDAVQFTLAADYDSPAGAVARIGIGENSTTTSYIEVAPIATGATSRGDSTGFSLVPAEGYRTVSLLVMTSSGTATIYSDDIRSGGATDPRLTYLSGTVTT